MVVRCWHQLALVALAARGSGLQLSRRAACGLAARAAAGAAARALAPPAALLALSLIHI